MRWMVVVICLVIAQPVWAYDGEYELQERYVPFGDFTGDREWSFSEHGRERYRIEYETPLFYDPDASFRLIEPTWKIYDCSRSWKC